MKKESPDRLAQLFWFAMTMAAVSSYTPFGYYNFPVAVALWIVAVLGGRLAGQAIFRLGGKARWLLVQLAIWFGVFLYFAPLPLVLRILVAWGIGLPLVLAGAVARRVYERFPAAQRHFGDAAYLLAVATLVYVPLKAWTAGVALTASLFLAGLILTLGYVALSFGWRLAERPNRGEWDAHLGSQETYHAAGVSDEH